MTRKLSDIDRLQDAGKNFAGSFNIKFMRRVSIVIKRLGTRIQNLDFEP